MLNWLAELKQEGLHIDHWNEYEDDFTTHTDMIRKILESSVNVWAEKLEKAKFDSDEMKASFKTQLSDETAICGVTWGDLKHKITRPNFDFYSLWVSLIFRF